MPIPHDIATKNIIAVNNLRICLFTMKLEHTITMGINYDPKLGDFVLTVNDVTVSSPYIFTVLEKAAEHQ